MRRERRNALLPFARTPFSIPQNKQAYSFSRVVLHAALIVPFCVLGAGAQTRHPADLVSGIVITAQGHPAGKIDVELRDLRGVRLSSGGTNDAGTFVIPGPTKPGEYILLASNGPTVMGEQISWRGGEQEFEITLPDLSLRSGPKSKENTVSVNRLETSEKARKYIQRAQAEFAQSRIEDALRDLDLLLREEPGCAAGLTMRALLRVATREFNGALEDARRAIALDPDNEEAHIAMATSLNSLGRFRNAGEASAQALMLNIDSWQARLELAKSLYGQNQFVLALHELDLLDVDFPDVRLVRANVLIRLGRRDDGQAEFAAFVKNFPHDPRTAQVRQILEKP